MAKHAHTEADLTKNQTLVMGALSSATGPLSAYTILDQLREEGLRAPLQVYRALDKLVEFGLVHRLESLNAFVACRHNECGDPAQTIFMICEICGNVLEVTDTAIAKQLQAVTAKTDFVVQRATVELRGTCGECQAA